MEPISELYSDICRRIGEAHARLMKDIEIIRGKPKDWAMNDLKVRARWAQYTLEVHDLECRRLWLERQLAETISLSDICVHISDKLTESPSGA